MQKTWVPLFSLCTTHAIWSPREERNYVRKDKIRVERWIKPGFKILLQKKTSNNYYTTTEILTTIERSSRLAYADFRQFRALHAKKTTYNSTTLVKLAKISLASKFLSWTKLSKNYGIADKTECDEKESFWEVCTKNLGSFGPRTRKEPTYKIEILVKSAKKNHGFGISIENKNLEVSDSMHKISCDETGTFPPPCAKFTRFKG